MGHLPCTLNFRRFKGTPFQQWQSYTDKGVPHSPNRYTPGRAQLASKLAKIHETRENSRQTRFEKLSRQLAVHLSGGPLDTNGLYIDGQDECSCKLICWVTCSSSSAFFAAASFNAAARSTGLSVTSRKLSYFVGWGFGGGAFRNKVLPHGLPGSVVSSCTITAQE